MKDKNTASGRSILKPTGVTNLYRNTQTGIYYLRTKINGREVKLSLDTAAKSTAIELLAQKLTELRDKAAQGFKHNSDLAIGEALDAFIAAKAELVRIGKLSPNSFRSLEFNKKKLDAAYGSKFLAAPIRKIQVDDLTKKHNDLHTNCSATIVNGVKALLVGAFKTGIANRAVTVNLAEQLNSKTPRPEEKALPTSEDLETFFAWCRSEGEKKYGQAGKLDAVADLVKFLSSFGCRIEEAEFVLRKQVTLNEDGGGDVLFTETKRDKPRRVPFGANIRPLIEKLLNSPVNRELDYVDVTGKSWQGAALLNTKNIHKTLTRACKAIKVAHWTHHTFRHYFATKALIATGCDYHTVSHWLGHGDGGKLLAKLYAHLDPKHSQKQIEKIEHVFAPKPAEVIEAPAKVTIGGKEYTVAELEALLAAVKPANVIQLHNAA